MVFGSKRELLSAAFMAGIAGILTQSLLFRELSIVLRPNDLIVGLLFFFWLLFVGLGSRMRPLRRRWNIAVLMLFAFVSIIVIWSHGLALLLSPGMGEVWPFPETTFLIAFSVGPLALLIGASFSSLAEALSVHSKSPNIYIFEGMGALLGGIISIFVAPIIPARIVLPIFAAAASILFFSFAVDRKTKRTAAIFSIAIFALIPITIRIDTILTQRLNKGYDVERFESAHGAIEIARRGNEVALFQGGSYLGVAGDSTGSELFVHSLMTATPISPRVALCGGILQGAARSVLEYAPESLIVMVEDRKMLLVGAANFDAFRRLDAPNLRIITGDPRRKIRDLPENLDLIIFYAHIPSSGAGSRIFSESAFRDASGRLADGGKIAMGFPISPNMPNPEEAAFIGSVLGAAREVFGDAEVYIAEGTAVILAPDGGEFGERLLAGDFSTPLSPRITREMVRSLPDQFRLDEIHREIAAINAPPNTDDRPIALLLGIELWERLAGGRLVSLLSSVSFTFWAFAFVLIAVLFYITGRFSRSKGTGAAFTVISVGTICMSIEIIALYGFQIAVGQLYAAIGLLSAMFIAGSVVGARCSYRGMIDMRRWRLIMLLVVPLALTIIRVPSFSPGIVLSIVIYGLFQCYIGFVAGSLYALVFGWTNSAEIWNEKAAGKIYAFDLLGASVAAPLVGVFLVPVHGLERTLFLVFILIIFVSINRFKK